MCARRRAIGGTAPDTEDGRGKQRERNESHYSTIVYSATKAAVSMLTVEYAKALPDMKSPTLASHQTPAQAVCKAP